MSTGRQEGRRKIVWIYVFFALVYVAATLIAAKILIDRRVYKTARVEAGVNITPQDFLRIDDDMAYFIDENKQRTVPDIRIPGEYRLRIRSGYFTHRVTLYVQDTIAPEGEAAALVRAVGERVEASEFMTYLQDATDVTVGYLSEPDFTREGEQKVTLLLTDLGENETRLETTLYLSLVKPRLVLEAGSPCPALEDFILGGTDFWTETELEALERNTVSEYEIPITVDGKSYVSILEFRDTVPPKAKAKAVESYLQVSLQPEWFADDVEDVTELSYQFEEEPDNTVLGKQPVTVLIRDAGGNVTKVESSVTLQKDEEAPVIEGAEDIEAYLDQPVSYRKNVTVTDNCEEGLTLEVDNSAVNISELGTYPVIYIARDLAGNESRITVELTVRERFYDVNVVYEKADEILASILKEDMDDREKVQAIFNYVRSHIGYIGDSEKDSWVRAAYEGLVGGRGDCFVYASSTKALLDRAGIPNMDIEKIPSKSRHYWNLVDIGDGHGWYHLDTTPRKDHSVIFLWTEEQLMAYSQAHYRSHNYDHDLYPEVP